MDAEIFLGLGGAVRFLSYWFERLPSTEPTR